MDYLIIGKEKLKVVLSCEELKRQGVSAEELDYSNPKAKKIFCDILEYAKREFGFDTAKRKVLIQLYPSRDGSCEVFISCTEKDRALTEGSECSTRAFCFERFEDLSRVCRILAQSDTKPQGSEKSSVWVDKNQEWFLVVSGEEQTPPERSGDVSGLSFISEYASAEYRDAISLYLGEYATEICHGNAIETLGTI